MVAQVIIAFSAVGGALTAFAALLRHRERDLLARIRDEAEVIASLPPDGDHRARMLAVLDSSIRKYAEYRSPQRDEDRTMGTQALLCLTIGFLIAVVDYAMALFASPTTLVVFLYVVLLVTSLALWMLGMTFALARMRGDAAPWAVETIMAHRIMKGQSWAPSNTSPPHEAGQQKQSESSAARGARRGLGTR